ncbi:MAG: YchJ family metal-binding protein [Cyanobacteria bacterium P01_A01_bin.135]
MAQPNAAAACPCGSGKTLADCCRPYLLNLCAPTAEALMRSRYTAYCLGNVDYLLTTHHPLHRAPDSRQAIAGNVGRVTWLGLTVLKAQQGQPEDKAGVVEFVALYWEGGQVGQLHERSQFRQQRGRWFYLQGEVLPPLRTGRNEPCWCGSGRKFKQCHGK